MELALYGKLCISRECKFRLQFYGGLLVHWHAAHDVQDARQIDHSDAGRYIGCLMSVTGEVVNVHAGPKAYHLNFGKDYRTDFTAVLFRKDLSSLVEEGLHPVTGYEGRFVKVTGILKEYNGPQVIVESADQLALTPRTD